MSQDKDWASAAISNTGSSERDLPEQVLNRLAELLRGEFSEGQLNNRRLNQLAQEFIAMLDAPPGEPIP
jgi:hypothetical protein